MTKIAQRSSARPTKTISRKDQGDASAAAASAPDRPSTNRRKLLRRRHIDPTTCEREYSIEEVEFMRAMEHYKRASGRMFPTCSEILEVFRSLGYSRAPQFEPLASAAGEVLKTSP